MSRNSKLREIIANDLKNGVLWEARCNHNRTCDSCSVGLSCIENDWHEVKETDEINENENYYRCPSILFMKDPEGVRVFISGKMVGLKPEVFIEKFKKAEKKLELWGFEPVNPCKIGGIIRRKHNWTREEAMNEEHVEEFTIIDDMALKSCKGIYMLDNYKDSPGALHELDIARKDGKFVIYED